MINNKNFTFHDAYEELIREVDKILSTSPSVVREYTSHLNKTRGKMIRAQAVLTCAMDENNEIDGNAIILAASIELIHLASLVHDDIIDNAELRRGQLSLQKKFGRRTAVICGDYLLTTALLLASSMEKKESYIKMSIPNYMGKVCLGELRQHVNNGNHNLSVLQYLRIISGKTGGLFEASFFGGAQLIKEEESEKNINEYSKLGRYIGMIFQLTDDCMDFESSEDVALKPVQSDYEQDVITLPLIYAYEKDPSLKKKALSTQLSREELNQAVRSTGSLERTRKLARKYLEKSIKIIDNLEATSGKKDMLRAILSKSYREFK